MMREGISVIVPAYNGERFLRDALESVFAQTLRPDEVIVVDDGSTDGTASVAQAFPGVRLIQQANRGLPGARNTGIAAARGPWIALLDADDIWVPKKLERQAAVAADGARDFLTSQHVHFVEPGTDVPAWMQRVLDSETPSGGLPSSWFMKRALFERVGLFDERERVFEDLEWLTRAHEAGVFEYMLPEELVRRRVHGANLSLTHARETRQAMFRMLRTSIHRRANAGAADRGGQTGAG
ncbi:MAG: glycosyltransferase family 2 protein [Tepidiformaceae bacterium]